MFAMPSIVKLLQDGDSNVRMVVTSSFLKFSEYRESSTREQEAINTSPKASGMM